VAENFGGFGISFSAKDFSGRESRGKEIGILSILQIRMTVVKSFCQKGMSLLGSFLL